MFDAVKFIPNRCCRSRFLWAAVLFLLANICLNIVDAKQCFTPAESAARSFDYSGIETGPSFLSYSPNVLLLGSSLLINPEWKVDRQITPVGQAGWANRTMQSASSYHLARGLELLLTEHKMKHARVYSLAAGGALISDSFLLLSHYLQNYAKPEVVVIDCAPRSFNDTGVTCPTSTVIFNHCFSLNDFYHFPSLSITLYAQIRRES